MKGGNKEMKDGNKKINERRKVKEWTDNKRKKQIKHEIKWKV